MTWNVCTCCSRPSLTSLGPPREADGLGGFHEAMAGAVREERGDLSGLSGGEFLCPECGDVVRRLGN